MKFWDFKEQELKDIAISALALALAFALVFEGGIFRLMTRSYPMASLAESFLIALIAGSVGFVLH